MKAMELDFDMLYAAANLMERQGGSFAGYIARAFYVADATNRRKLLTAFDELFCEFYRQVRRQQLTQQGENE